MFLGLSSATNPGETIEAREETWFLGTNTKLPAKLPANSEKSLRREVMVSTNVWLYRRVAESVALLFPLFSFSVGWCGGVKPQSSAMVWWCLGLSM